MHAGAAIKLEGDVHDERLFPIRDWQSPSQYKSTLAGVTGQLNLDLNSLRRSKNHTLSDHLVRHGFGHLLMNVDAFC